MLIQIINAAPVSRTSIILYLKALTGTVEENICCALPDKFALIFDEWTSGREGNVAKIGKYCVPFLPEIPRNT